MGMPGHPWGPGFMLPPQPMTRGGPMYPPPNMMANPMLPPQHVQLMQQQQLLLQHQAHPQTIGKLVDNSVLALILICSFDINK